MVIHKHKKETALLPFLFILLLVLVAVVFLAASVTVTYTLVPDFCGFLMGIVKFSVLFAFPGKVF